MKKIPVILDVDLGVDDACAVLLAFKSSNIEVLGVTTVFGNRQLERTNRNTLAFLEFIGKENIPVAKGADKPLVKMLEKYVDEGPYVVHGAEGLGYAEVPKFTKKNITLSAEDFIADTVRKYDKKITLIPVGPLTNIAKFIQKYPELLDKIETISLMGGGIDFGNITPYAEVNIYCDAEAAKIVFESGIPIIMCPLDATEKGFITCNERENITKVNCGDLGHFMFKALDCYGKFYEEVAKKDGCVLHDSMAVVAVSKPEILKFKPALIDIITKGKQYGRTIEITNTQENIKHNCMVATDVDRKEFIDLFFESLK